MSGLSLMVGDWPCDSGGKWAGSENGLAIIASRSNGGGVMIGSETRVLARDAEGSAGAHSECLSERRPNERAN